MKQKAIPAGRQGFAQIFIIIILLALIGGVLYIGFKQAKITPILTQSPVPTTISSTSDPTANWKTYTNTKFGFEIKLPADEGLLTENNTSTSFHGGMPGSDPDIIVTKVLTNINSLPACDYNSESPKVPCLEAYHDSGAKIILNSSIDGISAKKFYLRKKLDEKWIIAQTSSQSLVEIESLGDDTDINNKNFDQMLSTFKFTSQATDPNQQAITNLVNSFYTALANQDGKTLFSLMTPATTTAEKSDYNWLTGADLGVTPTYRVFIRSKINNQKITNIQKQTDESYLVSITDQSYGYSNAGSVVGFTSPEPRNNISMTVINIGSQWLIDKYTDQNYQGNPGSAPSLKYNGFGQ